MTTSLSQFCKLHNLAKTTVYNRLIAEGFDLSNGLSNEAEEFARQEYNLIPLGGSEDAPVFLGNHSTEVALTVAPGATTLQAFRSDKIRAQLADPKAFVQNVDGLLSQIEGAMDEAEAQQEAQLAEVKAVKRQTLNRLQSFRRRAESYRLKSDILATLQNQEIDEVGAIAAEVNHLGKPDGGESP